MGNFDANTRRMINVLPVMTKPSGGGTTSLQLPKSGLLSALRLMITGTASGTISAPHAGGFASVVKRVRVSTNTGVDIINVSGIGYHYLLRNFLNDYRDPADASNNARSAVSATTFDISMLLPIALNNRDATGLFLLQNEATQVTLSIDWETDATVGTGATIAATCKPFIEFFTVPTRPEDRPPLTLLHQIIEETRTVSGAGQVTYDFPRGAIYLQALLGAGVAQSPSDTWSAASLRIQQAVYLVNSVTPAYFDNEYRETHLADRLLGTISFDFIGSSGLGCYGKLRDAIDSSQLTDFAALITATGATTLYAIRRQLVAMSPG